MLAIVSCTTWFPGVVTYMQCDFVLFSQSSEVMVNPNSPEQRKLNLHWDCRVTGFKNGTETGWQGELDQIHKGISFRQHLGGQLGRKGDFRFCVVARELLSLRNRILAHASSKPATTLPCAKQPQIDNGTIKKMKSRKVRSFSRMNYSLNSSKGVIGDDIGEHYKGYLGGY